MSINDIAVLTNRNFSLVILGETHLRRVLATYADYYNRLRTHQSLTKDTPLHRIVERLGTVTSRPILAEGTPHLISASHISRRLAGHR